MSETEHLASIQLAELQGKGSGVDTILLVEPDEMARGVQERMLVSLFPGLRVESVAESSEALTRIRSDLRGKVAMVISETDGLLIEFVNELNGDGEDAIALRQKMPILLTISDIADPEKSRRAGYMYEDASVDGVLRKPFGLEPFERAILAAIARRRSLSAEIESSAKAAVLTEFCEYHIALARQWLKNIEAVSFFDESGKHDEQSKERDLLEVYEAAKVALRFLEQLERLGPNPKQEQLSKVIHDLNNRLTVLVGFIAFLKDACPEGDAKLLDVLTNELFQLTRYIGEISNAYNGVRSWSTLKMQNNISQLREDLELPKGTVFLVVDDDDDIINITSRNIEQKGGVAYGARNEDELLSLLEELGTGSGTAPQVVLLDNNLGNDAFGHQLIGDIRNYFPNVLIIAHTSDAGAINADPENPYKKAGVEVVGKREWHAVSGVIRRKLNPDK